MRLDLHVHTAYSYDSTLSLEAMIEAVLRAGLDGVAVLDHDQVEGAQRLQRLAPFRVIVGEEIGTEHGGIGALFVTEAIPPQLSVEETVSRIRAQGGLVYVPHPLARGVPGRLAHSKLWSIASQVDVIEGYNARTPLVVDDRRACEFAHRHVLAIAAGSDAHFAFEVGRAWTEMEEFHTPSEFLESLARAPRHHCHKTCPLVSAATVASIPLLWLAERIRRRLP